MSSEASPPKAPSFLTPALIVVSVVFLVLSIGAVALRFKARRTAKQTFQADDWWIVVSLIASLALSINLWVFTSVIGLSYYKQDIALGTQNSLWCIIISGCILQAAVTVVKISILLFYKRIFRTQKFARAVWAGIAVISVWGIITLSMLITQEDPVSMGWTGRGKARWNTTQLGTAQAVSSIILDVMVLAFPVPVILKLHMPMRKKLQVAAIFWLGAFCVVAAIARLVIFRRTVVALLHSYAYEGISLSSKTLIFQVLEVNCSIIAGCLPCYAPLMSSSRKPLSFMQYIRSRSSFKDRKSNEGSKTSHDVSSRAPSSSADTLENNNFDGRDVSRSWNISRAEKDYDSYQASAGVQPGTDDTQNSRIFVTQAVDVESV